MCNINCCLSAINGFSTLQQFLLLPSSLLLRSCSGVLFSALFPPLSLWLSFYQTINIYYVPGTIPNAFKCSFFEPLSQSVAIGAIITHTFEPTKGLVSIQDLKPVSATFVFRRVLKSGKNNSLGNEPVCLPWAARYRQVAARAGTRFGKRYSCIFFFLLKFSRRNDYKINWNDTVRNGPTPNYLDARVSQSQLLFLALSAILSKSSTGECGPPAAVAAGTICWERKK